jgi:Kef-type K+ transport system membrane component KefB
MAWLVLYVVIAVPFALLTAYKAKRMGQSFTSWLFVGLCLPVISLAVVQYFEPDKRRRDRA